MALIDKASLLMVPSTYEAGKLYNVLPSGNRAPDSTDQNSGYDQTRADFDFDRGSNAAATRVNASGLIEKYRENFLLQSNQFDTTWGSNGTLTSGQSGYDGSNDAWLFNYTTDPSIAFVSNTNSGVQTVSLYAKGSVSNGLRIYAFGSVNCQAFFDLNIGSVENTGNIIDARIEDKGNGWYRCSMTFNQTNSSINFYLSNNANLNATSGSIYIQDAQLESGLVASSYLESTSVTGKAGVLVDLPRINYDANGQNGALLLEPQRANLIPQSEYLAIGWTYDNTSVISNSIVSPTGEISASKLLDNTTNALHRMYYITGTSASAHRFSIFLKKAEYSKVEMQSLSGVTTNITYDLLNGTATSVGEIEPYGNDWYRCIFPMSTTSPSNAIQIRLVNNSNSNVFVGTGTSGVHMFGAMLEAGSYVSSYIPTMGTSETRAADSCSVTGASDVIGQTEGTMFMDVNLYARDSYTYFALAPNLGSTSSYIGILITATAFSFEVVYSGVQVAYNYSNSNTGNFKIAFAYKANDFVAYINGTQVMTDTSGSVPACSQIGLNVYDKDQPLLYKQATLFKERLTNAELATLTTL